MRVPIMGFVLQGMANGKWCIWTCHMHIYRPAALPVQKHMSCVQILEGCCISCLNAGGLLFLPPCRTLPSRLCMDDSSNAVQYVNSAGQQARLSAHYDPTGALSRGDASIFMRFPPATYREKIWDHCAGAIIVEEAGGRITDATGNLCRACS
jgi:hypothetical protein